jgi:hypothetical protein
MAKSNNALHTMKPRNPPDQAPTVALYLREIPDWLRSQFKAATAMKGTTMRKAILKFMKDYSDAWSPNVALDNKKPLVKKPKPGKKRPT